MMDDGGYLLICGMCYGDLPQPKTLDPVDLGTNSTYLHAHMPKINCSCVKICERSRPLLAQKFSIVTRAAVCQEEYAVKCYGQRFLLKYGYPR